MSRDPSDWPKASDVARRALILKHVVINGLATPPRDVLAEWFKSWSEEERRSFIEQAEGKRDQFWGVLFEIGLGDYLTDRERMLASYTALTMPPQAIVDSSWRAESVVVLMWALQLVNELPRYDTEAEVDLIKLIPHEGIDEFIRSAILRSHREISRARDMAELWHWRSRTRYLIESGAEFPADETGRFRSFNDVVRFTASLAESKGDIPPRINDDFPVKGKAYRDLTDAEWSRVRSITMERHYAFNWLCGYAPGNRWDETPTDT